ncbi:MAG: hypothetical protein M1833_002597 [Piccolia ochrophora]|nr:MAG: hypothetical protein M1833_002597 [Piccolia ochrophora]
MPTFFSKVFKGKDARGASAKSKKNGSPNGQADFAVKTPKWEDAWAREEVSPAEVQQLLRGCTLELKARALDMPFLLLPFRPTSDSSAARTFIRNYFATGYESGQNQQEETLQQELRLAEPMVLCSVMKWCWGRLPGGVVTWEAYELFCVGEQDSDFARDSFATFLPLSVDSDARTKIIFDFFDLLAAIAAHGKSNGLGGRKLSRLAGWWAFEHIDKGNGFDDGYKSWARAADATSHLFFAYLRSLTPTAQKGISGISALPISLQTLVQQTEYPPETPTLMQSETLKVIMTVDSVSPTPFALLRRAKHFEYRDDDAALQAFADFDDPVDALTEECRRVLRCISSANQSEVAPPANSTGVPDASWSRFEDIGFSSILEGEGKGEKQASSSDALRSTPGSRMQNSGRPATPSWADFLSSGFADEPTNRGPAPLLLPPDKQLPRIETSRAQSFRSHSRMSDNESQLEPGELASISKLDLDDSFWWVWITSLAGEESPERKAVFGRCALVETKLAGARWLIIEEKVKGAAPLPDEGAYIVEKKRRFGFTKKGRSSRTKTALSKNTTPTPEEPYRNNRSTTASKTNIDLDQHARIRDAAAALQQKHRHPETEQPVAIRRARTGEGIATKTNSVFTLQPVIMSEAAPAMKWANKFDRDGIREAYLANSNAAKGSESSLNGTAKPTKEEGTDLHRHSSKDRDLPALPQNTPASNLPVQSSKSEAALSTTAPSLPPTPAAEVLQTLSANSDAADVPLPAEKPLPATKNASDSATHPSAEEPEPQEPPYDAGIETVPSPPRKKGAGKKLQKRSGGASSGLKKLFGRKHSEPSAKPADSQAIEGRPSQPNRQESSPSRRFSSFRRKDSPKAPREPAAPMPETRTPVGDEPAVLSQEGQANESSASSSVSATPIGSPMAESDAPVHPFQKSQHSMSRVNTNEERDAAQEFSRFDQGPMDDVPAFVPEDSPNPNDAPEAIEGSKGEPSREEAQDETTELTREVSPPSQDRWAQIRKNAADRAAARASEDQSSRPSQSARTDDGETSGEETIESRVARIKARVAELTGNMDEQNGTKTSSK